MPTFYYIMHNDGGHMPVTKGNIGYTHIRPSMTEPPRLFKSERGARASIREWTEGPLVVNVDRDGNQTWHKDTVHTRSMNDWTIKEIEI